MTKQARPSNIDLIKKALEAKVEKELSYKPPQKLLNELVDFAVERISEYNFKPRSVYAFIKIFKKDLEFAWELFLSTDEERERVKLEQRHPLYTMQVDDKEPKRLDFKKILPKRKPEPERR